MAGAGVAIAIEKGHPSVARSVLLSSDGNLDHVATSLARHHPSAVEKLARISPSIASARVYLAAAAELADHVAVSAPGN